MTPLLGGGIYYDSYIIHSKKFVENGQFFRRIIREDHFSIVSQPEGLFLGYVPVKKGDAESASRVIISFLESKNILKELKALGCDGTIFNVGADGGINHFIEVELQRPLHWFICIPHMNELPLKKLITKLA